MTDTATMLRRRLGYAIHLGCVHIRYLAFAGGRDAEIADLADVLEFLPRYLDDEPTADDWDVIRSSVAGFAARYPGPGNRLVNAIDADPPEKY